MKNATWSVNESNLAYAAYGRVADDLSSTGAPVHFCDDMDDFFGAEGAPVPDAFEEKFGPVFWCDAMSAVTFDASAGAFRGDAEKKTTRYFQVEPRSGMVAEFEPTWGTYKEIACVNGPEGVRKLLAFLRDPSIGADTRTSPTPAMAVLKRVLVPFLHESWELEPNPLEGQDDDLIHAPVDHFVDATRIGALLALGAKHGTTWFCTLQSLRNGAEAHAELVVETRRARAELRDEDFVPRSSDARYVRIAPWGVEVRECPFRKIDLHFGADGFLVQVAPGHSADYLAAYLQSAEGAPLLEALNALARRGDASALESLQLEWPSPAAQIAFDVECAALEHAIATECAAIRERARRPWIGSYPTRHSIASLAQRQRARLLRLRGDER